MKFDTARLRCRSLTLEEYELFDSGAEPDWQELGNSNPFRHLIEGPNPLRHRIPRVKIDANFAEIALVLAFEKGSGELIGSSGFHDWPDADGMIEIGFGIVPERQNQGYGIELLQGMWADIIQRAELKILRYTVSPSNAPSIHIINKLGFSLVGEQVDEEDGVELIYEMTSQEYLKKIG